MDQDQDYGTENMYIQRAQGFQIQEPQVQEQMLIVLDLVMVKETLQEVIGSLLILIFLDLHREQQFILLKMEVLKLDGTQGTNGKEMWLE